MIETISTFTFPGIFISLVILGVTIGSIVVSVGSIQELLDKKKRRQAGEEVSRFPEESTGIIAVFAVFMSIVTIALSVFSVPANFQAYHVTGTVTSVENSPTDKFRFDHQTVLNVDGVSTEIIVNMKDHQNIEVNEGDTVELICDMSHTQGVSAPPNSIYCIKDSLISVE